VRHFYNYNMDNSFFAYLHRLELIAFFSGYPLIYTAIIFIAGTKQFKTNFKNRVVSLLPFAYALVGTCYLGLQLKKLYPDYSLENIVHINQHPYLMIWALLSILFWIPALAKKTVLSLLHSVVFFFLLIIDLFTQSTADSDKDIIRNDMRIYTVSLLLNLIAIAFIALLSFLHKRYKKAI
jgi:hypothetical protein